MTPSIWPRESENWRYGSRIVKLTSCCDLTQGGVVVRGHEVQAGVLNRRGERQVWKQRRSGAPFGGTDQIHVMTERRGVLPREGVPAQTGTGDMHDRRAIGRDEQPHDRVGEIFEIGWRVVR